MDMTRWNLTTDMDGAAKASSFSERWPPPAEDGPWTLSCGRIRPSTGPPAQASVRQRRPPRASATHGSSWGFQFSGTSATSAAMGLKTTGRDWCRKSGPRASTLDGCALGLTFQAASHGCPASSWPWLQLHVGCCRRMAGTGEGGELSVSSAGFLLHETVLQVYSYPTT